MKHVVDALVFTTSEYPLSFEIIIVKKPLFGKLLFKMQILE